MDFRDALQAVEESAAFSNWKEAHKSSFLVHAFAVTEPEHWEIGYFDGKVMGTFSVGKEVECTETSEVLKTEHDILQLDREDVKVASSKALEKAGEEARDSYPKEIIQKTFFIIQQLSSGAVYNITFFTKSFNTINIKLSAKDCALVRKSIEKLFDFG